MILISFEVEVVVYFGDECLQFLVEEPSPELCGAVGVSSQAGSFVCFFGPSASQIGKNRTRATEFSSVRSATPWVAFFLIAKRFCLFSRKYAVTPRGTTALSEAREPLSGVPAAIQVTAGATIGGVCGAGAFTVQ